MRRDLFGARLGYGFGEIADQQFLEFGQVRQVGGQDGLLQRDLRISQENGDFRCSESMTHLGALDEMLFVGQELDSSVEAALGFRSGSVVRGRRAAPSVSGFERDGLGLLMVVPEDTARHIVGHRRQERVALFDGHVAALQEAW